MKVVLFWYLQSQEFYKKLHLDALHLINIRSTSMKEWVDIGCGVGLMSSIATEVTEKVDSFDIDGGMIFWAKILHPVSENITFTCRNVMEIRKKYDFISATSLLSVVNDKQAVLQHLQGLLKNEYSQLIIIEPTEDMTLKNTYKMIRNFKSFWRYKMLIVWAKARQNKAVDKNIFDAIENISHHYFLEGMVRVSIIQKKFDSP